MSPYRPIQSGRTSLKDELSDLLSAGTKPKDFDPEELDRSDGDGGSDNGSDISEGIDEEAKNRGREHYVAVRKSKLRAKIDEQSGLEQLGETYVGKRVRRGEVLGEGEESGQGSEESDDEDGNEDGSEDQEGRPFEDLEGLVGEEGEDEEIDSDEAFGGSDEEKEWAKFKFRGSKTTKGGVPPKKGVKVVRGSREDEESEDDDEGVRLGDLEDSDSDVEIGDDDDEGEGEEEEEEGDGEEEEDSEGDGGSESDSGSDSDDVRSELRKAVVGDTSAASTTTSTVANTDVEKGTAVRAQQSTFDRFLGGRVKLQKALIAANDLALLEEEGKIDASSVQDTCKEAEEAALKLWNVIAEMRTDILPEYNNSKKRKAPEISTDTPISEITTHMTTLHTLAAPHRAANITKWTAQTHSASNTDPLLPHRSKRLNNTAPATITTLSGLPPHLDLYLHPPGQPTRIQLRLLSRAHVPRFCAPTHAERAIPSSDNIYDDSEFYSLLLNTLITQRSASVAFTTTSAIVQAKKALKGGVKMRIDKETGQMVKVDTKASKGRRLRYGVHDKLMDFMAPVGEKALGWWEERRVGKLFASLLGRREEGGEMDVDGEEGEGEGDGDGDGDGLEEDGLQIFS